jgi:YD repeat-containing protein
MPRTLVSRSSCVFAAVFASLSLVGSSLAQSGTTGVQSASPSGDQYGVGFDGSGAGCSQPILSIAYNPGENVAPGERTIEGLDLVTGAYHVQRTDRVAPASLGINLGETYNGKAVGGPADSSQGIGWNQSAQPEIIYDDLEDKVHLVYAAHKYVTYELEGAGSNFYVGINGAAGFFERIAAVEEGVNQELELFKFTDHTGLEAIFIGFHDSGLPEKGQLWKVRRPALEGTAYVGDNAKALAAVGANGWDDEGRVLTAFDSSGREYDFTYDDLSDGAGDRLRSIVVTDGMGEVGRIEYTYYNEEVEDVGLPGDLKTVTTTTPLSDDGNSHVRTRYYRYWTEGYSSLEDSGSAHQLQLVLDEEGVRRADLAGDGTFNGSYMAESTADLKKYAAAYLAYDSSDRVSTALFNGQCGCTGGGANGVHTITYSTNGSHPATGGYDPEWKSRAVVARPDGSYLTQYFDEEGQTLSTVISDGNPTGSPTHWVTYVVRNSTGHVSEVWSPLAIGSYTHSTGAIATNNSASGLVRLYMRQMSGAATGYLLERRFLSAADYDAAIENDDELEDVAALEHAYTWNLTDATMSLYSGTYVRPLLETSAAYYANDVMSGTTGAAVTAYEYDVFSNQNLAVQLVDEMKPTVASGNNGSGDAHHVFYQFRADGQRLARSERYIEDDDMQIVERWTYNADGQVSAHYEDADTTGTGLNTSVESAGSPINDSESFTYDAQGRMVTRTTHDGRLELQYWSQLQDRRLVSISFPHYDSTPNPDQYFGPATYIVTNHAGKSEFQSKLPFDGPGEAHYTVEVPADWIDEGESDPILALGDGSVDLSTPTEIHATVYDASGKRRTKSREYFLTPSSGDGTSGTNFDETTYAYDGMGRLIRTQASHETIWRGDYDKRGNVTARHIGTNDTGLDGSTSSGTSNMVKTDATAFDANGRVTSSTAYLESLTSGASRVTSYTLDLRGRRILTTSPTAPHALAMYDNLGRQTAVGMYSSASGLSAASVPYGGVSPAVTNRMALSRTLYDERGQVWKTVHHKIDATDGSDDDSLESLTWFDEMGRVIKVDGEQLAKYTYDRLGRRTHEFVLATTNDSVYDDAFDVAGDTVLEERQTAFDSDHHVWMTATVSRLHSDVTSDGELDQDTDPNVLGESGTDMLGRLQVTAYWFDELGRETDRAEFGTNDSSTNSGGYDRSDDPNTIPTRSSTVLVTSTDYDDAGRVSLIEDPKEQVTKFLYDDAGRTVAEIANFDNGTPSSETAPDDNITRYVYADGLMTQLWVDVNGNSTQDGNDQVTTYAFGTTKGTSAGESQIATGHLLQKETYPDSGGSSDVVTYAYNAQGEVNWKKDQAGNVIEAEFDGSGRLAARKVTTLDSDFDGAVLRIGNAYDDLGRTESVTQYSDLAATSVVDSVEYSYDDWGNLKKFNQDVLGNGGWRDVEYTYAEATTGRNTLRRTAAVLPNGQEYRYLYSSSSSLDDAASRVTNVANSSNTPLATYTYLGSGHVVKTYLEEPDAYSSVINSAGTAYEGLDQFNRPIKSRWTKDLSTDVDFFSVNVGWDRASNVQHQDDQVQVGHDTLYANDARNRLTDADEGTITIGTPSTIGTRTRHQNWVLTQTGNWSENLVDFNNDGDGLDTGELEETRAHNEVNELVSRDTNSSSPAEFNFVYDAVGNMTTDDENYQYKWDAFGRLREVQDLSNNVVSEYWYNGLGYLTVRLQDTNLDGVANSTDDRKYVTIYDERWRQVATYRVNPSTGALDANPKEQFLYHAAGNGGWGGSSYIDSVILRDSVSNSWTAVGASTLSKTLYYCQNWRADVVVMLDVASTVTTLVQNVRYSAYGVPFGIPYGDVDSDGDCDGGDDTQVSSWIGSLHVQRPWGSGP